MTDYVRQHIFSSLDGQALAGQDLDDDFNAVQAAIADLSDQILSNPSNAPLMVDASDPVYAPSGTETNAARVAAAIQAALNTDSRTKTVLVPVSMWGYCADVDFAPGIFDPTIHMVREGAVTPWYDPVAYGADPTGAENSYLAVKQCFDSAAAYGDSQAGKVVAFTVAGEYLLNTAVAEQGVAVVLFPGITFTGTAMDGDVAWTLDGLYDLDVGLLAARPVAGTRAGHGWLSSDTGKLDVWDGAAWVRINPDPTLTTAAFSYNPGAASGSRATTVAIVKILHLHVVATNTNASGQLVVNMGDTSFGGAYSLANLHTVVASERGSNAGNVEPARIAVNAGAQTITLDLDGGVQSGQWDIVLTFTA